MLKIYRFLFTIIQLILLIDSTKQSKIRQAATALKAIGSTIKRPIMKTVNNTIKSSLGMFRHKKHNIKNLVFDLEKNLGKYFKTRHSVKSRFVQDLGKDGFNKYKASWIIREGKKNTQMKSAQYMSGKGIRSLFKTPTKLMKGKELGSLLNMISQNKVSLPLLGLGSLIGLTKFNVVSTQTSDSSDLSNSDAISSINTEKMKTTDLSGFTELEKVITSSFDKREYFLGKLDNDMPVLLISDKDTEKSAASITMGVGSLDETKEFFGLAHFFEHVLFLGSKKYPKPLEYEEFFTNQGGASDAFTDDHMTFYGFDCHNEAFYEALDRTVDSIKHPLFNKKYTKKEISAIISEYVGYQQDDGWRKVAVLSNVSDQKSFFNRFTIGNKETLNKPGTRQALFDFHAKYYSSNICFACLLTNQPIDTMKKYAIELLSSVENKKVERPSYKDRLRPYGLEQLKKQVLFEKVNEGQEMTIYFSLPFYHPQEDASLNYINNAIEHQGKGSIFQELFEKGWILDIETGYDIKGKNNSLMSYVDLALTEQGLDNYAQVASSVMSYIEMLRTTEPQEWFYDELKLMDDHDFTYRRKKDPYDTVEEVGSYAGVHNFKHLLNHNYHFVKFNPERIKEQLGQMTYENSLILLSSANLEFSNNDYKVEKYFQVKYQTYDYSAKLQSLMSKDYYKPKIPFSQPKSNKYIARNFDLQSETDASLKGVDKVDPVLILSDKGCDIWYKPDVTYQQPKAITQFQIYSNDNSKLMTPHEAVYSQIWMGLLKLYLKEETNQAELAGCELKLGTEEYGIELVINSFTDSMLPFVEKLSNKIANFKEDFDETKFETIRNDSKEAQGVSFYINPILQAHHYLDIMINPKLVPRQGAINAYDEITFEGYKNYCKTKIWSKLFFQGQFSGNITKENSIKVYKKLKDSFSSYKKYDNLERKDIIQFPILKLAKDETSIYSKFLKNEDDQNSAILKYYQLDAMEGDSETRIKESFSLRLIAQYLEDRFHTELRTEQQLGYMVYLQETRKRGVLGLTFGIRGYVEDPNYCSERITDFLESHQTLLEEQSEEEFDQLKTDQLQFVSKKPISLHDESQVLFYHQIYSQSYNWDYIEKKKRSVSSITKDDAIKLYKKLFQKDKKVLEIHMVSNEMKEKYEESLEKRAYKNLNKILKDGEVLDTYDDKYAYKETYEKSEQYNDI